MWSTTTPHTRLTDALAQGHVTKVTGFFKQTRTPVMTLAAVRVAVRYEPPTMALEYREGGASGELKLLEVPLRDELAGGRADAGALWEAVAKLHPAHFSASVVSVPQVRRLLGMICDTCRSRVDPA